MLDLRDIRNKVETAFNGFNFNYKRVCVSLDTNQFGEKLDVTLYDLGTDFYARYRIANIKDESEITVIDKDNEVVRKQHTKRVVLKAMIKHMKEWGVNYDNT